MNSSLIVPLNPTPEQAARLQALQTAFAEVCNALAPVVREKRCWNRVTLHHLTYHALRERFPQIGSQMVCNAIYSVCRTSRLVYQHPNSPFNVTRLADAPLPLIRFIASAPVYFDRHTLSIKNGKLSMYTLDGRMRFQLDLKPEDLERFQNEKLLEIVLSKTMRGYQLAFAFLAADVAGETDTDVDTASDTAEARLELPEYVIVQPEDEHFEITPAGRQSATNTLSAQSQ